MDWEDAKGLAIKNGIVIKTSEDSEAPTVRELYYFANSIEQYLISQNKLGWRPIETAPKDGRGMLVGFVLDDNWHYRIAFWQDGHWFVACSDGKECNPTHWKPLPFPDA